MKLAPFYLISLALIGIANTLYLSYFAYTGTFPSCTIGGCTDVLTSSYSKFFGVPLAYLGLVYYAYMLLIAALLAIEPFSKALRFGTLVYTGVGVLCSALFVYIQGVLIGSFCQYCLISALTTVLLFGVSLWHFRTARN